MKTRFHCWKCDWIKWSSADEPKCPSCHGPMRIVANDRCNVCGRELINKAEDASGICKACTGKCR